MTDSCGAGVLPARDPAAALVLRTARAADAPALQSLYAQLIPDRHPALVDIEACIEAMNGSDQAVRVIVGELDGRVIATCQHIVYPNPIRMPQTKAMIDSVVVDEAWRGRHIGTRLMRWSMEELKRRGCAHVIIAAAYKRTVAHELYKRLGFAQTGLSFIYDTSDSD